MHVVVVGAGVVGLSGAWYLVQRGVRVTLLDRQPDVAMETSHANGGQLSYSYVAPLADPSVLGKLPSWLLKADSPLRFTPRLDPRQWVWCLNFLRCCNAPRVERTITEMLELSLHSRQLMERLLATHPLDFQLSHGGKLVVYRDAQALQGALPSVALQRSLGIEQQVLDRDACVALEPALAGIAGQLQGGIFTASEVTADCRLFCQELLRLLRGMDNVTLHLDQPVLGLTRQGGRVAAVSTAQGELQADAFVLAAGLDSQRLARPLGVSLPLYGLRGYSLTAALPEGMPAMRLSVTDAARKIVFAPLGEQVRIAAMVDMGVKDASVDPRRIELLKRQVGETLPQLDLRDAQPWAGLRPSTASSRPIIDRAANLSNLWLNVGHGALGFTLACASGDLLAAQMLGEPLPLNPAAFRL